MAEFMRHDTDENQDNEGERIPRRLGPVRAIGKNADKGQKEQKGHMNPNSGSSDASEINRPPHDRRSYLTSFKGSAQASPLGSRPIARKNP
jgi:hypothetical protein